MKAKNILRRAGAVLAGALLLPAIAWADSAALSAFEMRAGGRNLVEGFDSDVTSYDVQLPQPAAVTLSAVPESGSARVVFTVNGNSYTNHSVAPLQKGKNTIECTVTDGTLSRTYTLGVQASEPHRTLYFKSSWSSRPYVYIYTDTPSKKEFTGVWPGATMEKYNSDWYSFTLDDEADSKAMVIFNTGKSGADRYPAAQKPGILLDFDGYEGWYVLDEKKFYTSNPDGPRKPEIAVTPQGGKVKGSRTITISSPANPGRWPELSAVGP